MLREGSLQSLYRPELDALRFVAFLLVFVHHVGLSGGVFHPTTIAACGFGLPLFFFLSAFLITGILSRERRQSGTVSLGRFYARRALRIWPLYFAALGFGILMSLRSGGEDGATLPMVLAYATFTADWYYAGGAHDWPGSLWTPLWSISVEEQFYLVWPLFYVIAGRGGLFVASVAIVAMAIAVQYRLGDVHAETHVAIWVNPLVQMEFFGVGAIVSLVLNGGLPTLRPETRVALLALAGMAWIAAASLTPQNGFAVSGLSVVLLYQGAAVGCVAIVVAILGMRPVPPAGILYLGRISFGLYVFHLYGLAVSDALAGGTAARFVVGLPLTAVLAALSYRNLEAPFLAMKGRLLKPTAAPRGNGAIGRSAAVL